eukprot:scaffold1690_cov182-Amphora_coffeaeformis.AAC.35
MDSNHMSTLAAPTDKYRVFQIKIYLHPTLLASKTEGINCIVWVLETKERKRVYKYHSDLLLHPSLFSYHSLLTLSKSTMTLHAVTMNSASSSQVESRDATTQANKADASTCRTATPPAGVIVENDPCFSSPLSSKKAFFENVFKKKDSSSTVPKKLVTKVWSPRRQMVESSPSSRSEVIRTASSSPRFLHPTTQGHYSKPNSNEHWIATGVDTLKKTGASVVRHEDRNGLTRKNVPAVEESLSTIKDIAPPQSSRSMVCEPMIDMVKEIKHNIVVKPTDPPDANGEPPKTDPPGTKDEEEEETVENEESKTNDANQKLNHQDAESPVVHASESVRSSPPSEPTSVAMQPTPTIETSSSAQQEQDSDASHSPLFDELKQMWGIKAATSKPLSPEKDLVVAEANGQKVKPREETIFMEVKMEETSDDTEEEKKEEVEDIHLLFTKLETQPSSSTKDLPSSLDVHSSSSSNKEIDQGMTIQNASESPQKLVVGTSLQNDVQLDQPKKEEENTESTTEDTVLLADTVDRAEYLTKPTVKIVVEDQEVKDNERDSNHDEESDEESDGESVFGMLLEQSPKDPLGAIKDSAASLTDHAKRSLEKYQAMMDITEEYRVKEVPTKPALASPIGDQIKKFEAFSKGGTIDNMSSEVADMSVQGTDCTSPTRSGTSLEDQKEKSNKPASPNRFSFYQPGQETLNLLERLSEPVDVDAFAEETPTSNEEIYSHKRGFVAKAIKTIESGEHLCGEDEVDEEDDEIVRVTKRTAAAVRQAASKMSAKSSGSRSVSEIERLPSKEVPAPCDHDEAQDNLADVSVLTDTDALTTAEMDTTFALDEDTYDQAMAMIAGVDSKATDESSPKYGGGDSIGISRSQSHQYEAVDHAKCGEAACVIM